MIDQALHYPKLRLLDGQSLIYEGMSYLHLRDPLALSGTTILVPQPLIPILPLLDGTRDVESICLALAIRHQMRLTEDQVTDFIQSLDQGLLLENDHYHAVRSQALHAYRQSSFRQPSIAGEAYPADPQELTVALRAYQNSPVESLLPKKNTPLRGLISPHIDYERGGTVYAQVWQQAAQEIQEAELVILLGTDHFSEGFPLSLTTQHYATPYGILPTDQTLVNRLAAELGDTAFSGEAHHIHEHSIELASIWLHAARGQQSPLPLLPILCGPLTLFENSSASPADDRRLQGFLHILQDEAAHRKTLVVAAGDLAHIGPAFGGLPVSPNELSLLEKSDHTLIDLICQGNAEGFYQAIHCTHDRNNICGTTAIYLALRILGISSGQLVSYSICPADIDHSSFVSIAGILLN